MKIDWDTTEKFVDRAMTLSAAFFIFSVGCGIVAGMAMVILLMIRGL